VLGSGRHGGEVERLLTGLQGAVGLAAATAEHLSTLGIHGAVGAQVLLDEHGLAGVDVHAVRADHAVGSTTTSTLEASARLEATVGLGLAGLEHVLGVHLHLALGVDGALDEGGFVTRGALLQNLGAELDLTVRLELALAVDRSARHKRRGVGIDLGGLELRLTRLQATVRASLAGAVHLSPLGVDSAVGLEALLHEHGLAVRHLEGVGAHQTVRAKAANLAKLRARAADSVASGLACLEDVLGVLHDLALRSDLASHENRLRTGHALLEHLGADLKGAVGEELALAEHSSAGGELARVSIELGLVELGLAGLEAAVGLELASAVHLGALGIDQTIGAKPLLDKHGLAIVDFHVVRADKAVGAQAADTLEVGSRHHRAVRHRLAGLEHLSRLALDLAVAADSARDVGGLLTRGALLQKLRAELQSAVRAKLALAEHSSAGDGLGTTRSSLAHLEEGLAGHEGAIGVEFALAVEFGTGGVDGTILLESLLDKHGLVGPEVHVVRNDLAIRATLATNALHVGAGLHKLVGQRLATLLVEVLLGLDGAIGLEDSSLEGRDAVDATKREDLGLGHNGPVGLDDTSTEHVLCGVELADRRLVQVTLVEGRLTRLQLAVGLELAGLVHLGAGLERAVGLELVLGVDSLAGIELAATAKLGLLVRLDGAITSNLAGSLAELELLGTGLHGAVGLDHTGLEHKLARVDLAVRVELALEEHLLTRAELTLGLESAFLEQLAVVLDGAVRLDDPTRVDQGRRGELAIGRVGHLALAEGLGATVDTIVVDLTLHEQVRGVLEGAIGLELALAEDNRTRSKLGVAVTQNVAQVQHFVARFHGTVGQDGCYTENLGRVVELASGKQAAGLERLGTSDELLAVGANLARLVQLRSHLEGAVRFERAELINLGARNKRSLFGGHAPNDEHSGAILDCAICLDGSLPERLRLALDTVGRSHATHFENGGAVLHDSIGVDLADAVHFTITINPVAVRVDGTFFVDLGARSGELDQGMHDAIFIDFITLVEQRRVPSHCRDRTPVDAARPLRGAADSTLLLVAVVGLAVITDVAVGPPEPLFLFVGVVKHLVSLADIVLHHHVASTALLVD